MADNLAITAGSGTTIGADEISGVKYQRVKMIVGADGTNDGDVSSANPLPISGTVTANLSATDNAVLDAIQTATEAIQTGQLADGHNVTVDNASIAVTATDLDVRDLTATDVVTVTGGAGQTTDVKVTLDSESVAVTNAGLTELASAINSDKLDINLKTSEVSIGGGTEYTEGDTDISITGKAIMFESNTGTSELSVVSEDAPLPVTFSTPVSVSGEIGASVSGVLEHDAPIVSADEDYPILIGGRASATAPTDVSADDDIAMAWYLRNGSQVVNVASGGNLIGATSNALDVNIKSSDISSAGGTSAADDADFSAGTTAGTPVMGVYESTPSSVTDGDLGTVGITANRELKISGNVVADLGANNDVTVTGTVDLGATDNAVLDDIASKLGTIDTDTSNLSTKIDTLAGAVAGTEMQVDVLTMPANVDVQSGGADLATTTQAGAIQTAVELIDDAIYVDDTATHATGTSKGVGIMAVATPTDTAISANDIGMIAMSVDRRQLVDANMQQGDADVAAGNPLQVSLANTAANATAVKVNIASGGIASGGIASGAIASGAIASGAIASGAIAAGAIAAGNTSIATTEDTARAGGEHLVKVGLSRLDTPVANANVSNDGDYTNFIADNFGKLWVAGTVPEDTAHVAGEALTINGVRRIDTPTVSAGSSGDWATMDASAEGAIWTTNTPTTTGGCTIFRSIDLDESEEEIKATAGNVYGYYYYNAATSVRYLKFYNATAANVTVGTTTPVLTLPLPASTAAHISFSFPVGFATAITAAATTGLADNDTGAPGANEVILNVFYK